MQSVERPRLLVFDVINHLLHLTFLVSQMISIPQVACLSRCGVVAGSSPYQEGNLYLGLGLAPAFCTVIPMPPPPTDALH
ncbi:hypothetical protein E4T56_gene382 [Termitomyces sp. T112]|nr:hypothetical protein E4T56_gene382 [Termitomyces sp. T112]